MSLLMLIRVALLSALAFVLGRHAWGGLLSGRILSGVAWRSEGYGGGRNEKWGDRRRTPLLFWLGVLTSGGLAFLLFASVLIQLWEAAGTGR